jgi:superfamily II DNA/RNA helicase
MLFYVNKEMTEQAKELSDKPHVVIATPGRLADHIESGTDFSLKKIQLLVSFDIHQWERGVSYFY